MAQTATALKAWEAENKVLEIDSAQNALYNYSPTAQKSLNDAHPWRSDPRYFTSIRISALALLKMVMHARSGGNIEVMGLMQGYVTSNTFVVTDAFRLPVEGTETRVNAQEDGNEYMVNYLQSSREGGGRPENAVGWYHSHPGYGCWLSGIDVATQLNQQTFQDPFVAVVIDPDRTISAGKVEIGAFRTYPKDYKPPSTVSSFGGTDEEGYQSIPMGKVEDFGAHASQYYSLEVSHFKSTLDTSLLSLLWNKYWVATLSQSPLLTNRDYTTKQIADLAEKTKTATRNLKSGYTKSHPTLLSTTTTTTPGASDPSTTSSSTTNPQPSTTTPTTTTTTTSNPLKIQKDPTLDPTTKAAQKIEREELTGLMAEEVKEKLFWGVVQEALLNGAGAGAGAPPSTAAAAASTATTENGNGGDVPGEQDGAK